MTVTSSAALGALGIALAILANFGPSPASAHGHLIRPLDRASLWMDPAFPAQPVNEAYAQNWCGDTAQDLEYTTCGRCGDGVDGNNHTHGGLYGNGFIADSARYESGSVIEVEAEFTWAHYGFFQLDLCARADGGESDDCFEPLQIVGGSQNVTEDGRQICVPLEGHDGWSYVTALAQLPAGLRCERCTLRWTYRGATAYGTLWPGIPGFDPCYHGGPAQSFRNCADIAIH